jgi:hypothetical protein
MKYVECKYSLIETFTVQTIVRSFSAKMQFCELHPDGRLTIHAGYCWDGATGALDTDDILLASCIHDIFCEMIAAGLLPVYSQALADEEFRLVERRQNMPWYRRFWTYMVVRGYQIAKDTENPYVRPVLEISHQEAGLP